MCGRGGFKEIPTAHLRKHNLTRNEYMEKYPLSELISKNTLKKLSIKATLEWANRSPEQRHHTEEAKKKIGDASRGKHHKGHPAWNKGKSLSVEHKQNLHLSHIGKPTGRHLRHSDETRQLISEIQMGRILNNIGLPPTWKGVKRGYFDSVKNGRKIRYDSNLECSCLKCLELLPSVTSFDRCNFDIKYSQKDNSVHRYNPDFKATLNNKIVIIEVKPQGVCLTQFNDSGKHVALSSFCIARGFNCLIYSGNNRIFSMES